MKSGVGNPRKLSRSPEEAQARSEAKRRCTTRNDLGKGSREVNEGQAEVSLPRKTSSQDEVGGAYGKNRTEHSLREGAPGKEAEKPNQTYTATGGTRSEVRREGQTGTACDEETGDKTEELMEEVLRRENLIEAYRRVKRNKGAAGVDGMEVEELLAYCQENWGRIREELESGEYMPKAIRGVEIPKGNGGKRVLGIPVVVDRLIMQALLQRLTPRVDPTFSESSYGYRPGRSAQEAIRKAREYVREGYSWVVDIDIEKFFDGVDHDIMMSRMARRIKDKRVLKLLRRFLQAGMVKGGVEKRRREGTPQGSPISPMLGNILLDEVDKELEKRGHRFCRYADDTVVYVKSAAAGRRVMASMEKFLKKQLKLKMNREKSAVVRPWESKFLGYSFTEEKKPRVRISGKSLLRLKEKLKPHWKRGRGRKIETTIRELNRIITGWVSYYRQTEVKWVLRNLDKWIRRRIRCLVWRQWKRPRTRLRRLLKQKIPRHTAMAAAYTKAGPWKASRLPAMHMAYPNKKLKEMGLKSLLDEHRRFAHSI